MSAEALTDRAMLSRLVAIDSTSRLGNEGVVDLIGAYLDVPRIRVRILPGSAEGDEGPARRNMIVTTGPATEDGAGLTWSGHLDCVPALEPNWTGDPFVLAERDGQLVGRGACDMKGPLAVALNAMRRAAATDLKAPFTLVLTCDEELGSLGARHLVDHWPADEPVPPTAVIVGEPTSLEAVRMHKGHLTMRLDVDGVPAHSGSPHLGRNAIEPAARAIVALSALREDLARERVPASEHFEAVPFAALTVARVRGGEALNVIPPSCSVEVGVRPLPGQPSETLADRIERAARGAVGEAPLEFTVLNDNPPMETRDDAPVHRAVSSCIGQTDSRGVSFASDGGHLRRLGLECVLFGPGSIEVAHRADEFIPIAELERYGPLLDQLVDRFCRREEK